MIEAVVTDIEGTTTSVTFVFEVLFPYAREHMGDFISRHDSVPEVREQLDAVARQAGRPLSDAEAVAQLIHWIDQDRKTGSLKALQGMLWKAGYEQGDFTGHVYPDAVQRLRLWHRKGLRLFVYSSGSVQAQQLLFAHSDAGDLTGLFEGWFDTATGPKREPDSYRAIAAKIGLPGGRILFLSDVAQELDAAREAGMATGWLVRDSAPEPQANHPQFADFSGIEPDGF